jgi:hypothetical protein
VSRSAIRGSISNADAMLVKEPPHATNKGMSVSSRIASSTMASAAGVLRGASGESRPVFDPARTRTSERPVSSAISQAAARDASALVGDAEKSNTCHLTTDHEPHVDSAAQEMVGELNKTVRVTAIVVVRDHADARFNH